MKIEAKIEVKKGDKVFYYTGTLSEFDNEHYRIDTIRGEHLVFRKEQVTEIQEQRSDSNGQKS